MEKDYFKIRMAVMESLYDSLHIDLDNSEYEEFTKALFLRGFKIYREVV